MLVPLAKVMVRPNTNMVVYGGRAFGRQPGHDHAALMSGTSTRIQEAPEECSLAPPP